MAGGFFKWAAPLFARADRRWTSEDASAIATMLLPFITEDGALLDVGGGTGGLAVLMARALGRAVTIIDASPEMLSYVPADPRVEAVRGLADAMPFADSSFAAVLVCDAFHHFRDQDAVTREIARVVRPGGGVLILDLDRVAPWMWTVVWGERLVGEPATFLTPDEMCSFMARRGIDGTCRRRNGPSYSFLGAVRR